MKNRLSIIQILAVGILFTACTDTTKTYDASGSFEAIERTISAEATGKILALSIEEGTTLSAGDSIGKIDISNLALQSEQVKAAIDAIGQKTNSANAQVEVLVSQLQALRSQTATLVQQIENVDKEVVRFQNLVKSNAVPQKQLDDLVGQKAVLQRQLTAAKTQENVINAQVAAAKTNVNIQNRAILSEVKPNQKRLAQIEKQMQDGLIINAFDGTVTTKLAYDGEFTNIGKPLYKIADLTKINLKVYITGNQLPLIKLNQEVTVRTDDGKGGFKETKGKISWISSKAEFTPKTIQTKDERANMVYGIKVSVPNDGSYKMGMYGEVTF